jgi:hypothetical protein
MAQLKSGRNQYTISIHLDDDFIGNSVEKNGLISVEKFPSDAFDPHGLLILEFGLPDSILSDWANKIRYGDFRNRISGPRSAVSSCRPSGACGPEYSSENGRFWKMLDAPSGSEIIADDAHPFSRSV